MEKKLWEIKMKPIKKEQNPQKILISQHQKIENKGEMLRKYARYYKDF